MVYLGSHVFVYYAVNLLYFIAVIFFVVFVAFPFFMTFINFVWVLLWSGNLDLSGTFWSMTIMMWVLIYEDAVVSMSSNVLQHLAIHSVPVCTSCMTRYLHLISSVCVLHSCMYQQQGKFWTWENFHSSLMCLKHNVHLMI